MQGCIAIARVFYITILTFVYNALEHSQTIAVPINLKNEILFATLMFVFIKNRSVLPSPMVIPCARSHFDLNRSF